MATSGGELRAGGGVSPVGWSLPLAIAIIMFGATGIAENGAPGLHPAVQRSVDALDVVQTQYAPLTPSLAAVSDLQKGCAPDVVAIPLATSIVELEIVASCDAGQAITVQHEGLEVSAILDDVGRVIVTLPTLRKEPVYTILVAGQPPLRIDADPLDFGSYAQTVLLAAPDTGFELHAYEGAALFGEPGHVQPGQPYDPVRALVGTGGFLAKVGTPSLLGSQVAQIYTVPEGTEVDLSLEAEVTEANCGREISAVTIRTGQNSSPVATPWKLRMPGCDALGEIVLLGQIGP